MEREAVRPSCMNFTYSPLDFAINMDMIMNENVIYTNSISAKNPPAACLPVIIPYLPSVDFCARVFDIHTPGQNLHMCLDFETRIQRAPVLVLHFNCMVFGASGFNLIRPGDASTLPILTTTDVPVIGEDYDDVTEVKYKV